MACAPPLALEPGQPLPKHLSKLGLDRARDVYPYTPSWPLWSDGLDKQRWVYVPPGKRVKTHGEWQWPEGSLLLKTFSFEGDPLETRALYRVDGEWEFDVWQWDGDDAELLPLDEDVTLEQADHQIPSRFECKQCHDAGHGVLGFSAQQLSDPGEFAKVFEQPPAADPVRGGDPVTTDVLGYFVGNCVHCHNGEPGDEHSFDLRPDVALDNVINVETDSSATAPGIRVVPGDPDDSILFEEMLGDSDTNDEIRAMPPLGVSIRDEAALDLFRRWIGDL